MRMRVEFRKDSGSGGFMDPPGHAHHTYSVYVWEGRRRPPDTIMSVQSAAESDWLPESARKRAQEMLSSHTATPSELWIRNVYGYFRNMYLPEGAEWNTAGDLKVGKPGEYPHDRHAAVLMVRKFFPGHEPRADLIADASYCYGQYACVKCGAAVQYEPRLDALSVYGSGTADCAAGGIHEWPKRDSE